VIDNNKDWWTILGGIAGIAVLFALIGGVVGVFVVAPKYRQATEDLAPLDNGDVWLLAVVDPPYHAFGLRAIPDLRENSVGGVFVGMDEKGKLRYIVVTYLSGEENIKQVYIYEVRFVNPLDPTTVEYIAQVEGHVYLWLGGETGCWHEGAHEFYPDAQFDECVSFSERR